MSGCLQTLLWVGYNQREFTRLGPPRRPLAQYSRIDQPINIWDAVCRKAKHRRSASASAYGSLFLVTLLFASATACLVYLRNAFRQEMGYGPYAGFAEWPRALVELIGEDTALRQDVQPFGLDQFIDHRSVWRIKPRSALRDRLFEDNTLEPTSSNHPKASELMSSVPSAWGKYRWQLCTWHATPGYGTTHIEGVNLYLVADDPYTGDLIVLHEWIF